MNRRSFLLAATGCAVAVPVVVAVGQAQIIGRHYSFTITDELIHSNKPSVEQMELAYEWVMKGWL